MDSPNISSNQRDHSIATGRSFEDAWEYWRCFVTPEPISNGLREMIRLDLRKQWYSDRLQAFRFWTLTNWARIDSEKILLDSDVSNIDSQRKASFFCNRPSAFYWLQSIQGVANGDRHVTPTYVFATVFGEWYRQYDSQPNIEFGHFLANPVRVTERGPTTIRGIVKAHISVLEKAKSILHKVNQGVSSFTFSKQVKAGNYRIHPLYKALILMVDRDELGDHMEEFRRPDRYIRLQDIAHFQCIIIARTGAEEQLSAPISFESLHSKALPLDRIDFDGEPNVDVIRVTLPDAVRFVIDLEKREDFAAFGETTMPNIDRSLSETCEKVFPEDGGFCDSQYTWADEHITAAEKYGYEHCIHTARSIRRVQAHTKGEVYMDLSPMWFAPRWIDYEGELGEQL
ncbi:MAG: hypothetical protein Q9217_005985 [Psora testacea]